MERESENQGEGNVTAGRRYNEKTREFIENTDVEAQAQKARKALDGEEGNALKRAEEKGAKGQSDADTVAPPHHTQEKR
jgi:hypothetical protein